MPLKLIENGDKKNRSPSLRPRLHLYSQEACRTPSYSRGGPLIVLLGSSCSTWSHASRARFFQPGSQWLVGWLPLWGLLRSAEEWARGKGVMEMDVREDAWIILGKHMLLGAKRRPKLTRDYIILEGRGAEVPRLEKKALSWREIEHGEAQRDS